MAKQPYGVICQRPDKGSERRSRGTHPTLVKRANGGTDYAAQTCEAADGRARQARFARSAPDRCIVITVHRDCVRANIPRRLTGMCALAFLRSPATRLKVSSLSAHCRGWTSRRTSRILGCSDLQLGEYWEDCIAAQPGF